MSRILTLIYIKKKILLSTTKETRILYLTEQSCPCWILQSLCFFLPPFGLSVWALLIFKLTAANDLYGKRNDSPKVATYQRFLLWTLCQSDQHWWGHIWSVGFTAGLPNSQDLWAYWRESSKGHEHGEGTGASFLWGRAERAGTAQLGEEKAQGGTSSM